MALPEIFGVELRNQGNYPLFSGIEIQKQSSLPVLSGLEFSYQFPFKRIAITNKGYSELIHDSKKMARTQKGFAVNLNPSNSANVFYQLI